VEHPKTHTRPNTQFAPNWLNLGNPRLQANQWTVYLGGLCICSTIVIELSLPIGPIVSLFLLVLIEGWKRETLNSKREILEVL